MSDFKDLIRNEHGSVVALITYSNQVALVDILNKKAIRRFGLLEDTDTRVAFDFSLDRILIGSWTKGLSCHEINSGKILWHLDLLKFTWTHIIKQTGEICVNGFKDFNLDGMLLDLNTGSKIRTISGCNRLLTKQGTILGLDQVRRKLLIFDGQWNRLGSPKWKSWDIWDFACDKDGILVVIGADGYTGAFIPGDKSAFAETKAGEYFSLLHTITWSKKHQCFFSLAWGFHGREGYDLIRFDHHLRNFEKVCESPIIDPRIVDSGKYIVDRVTGVVFDLDSLSEREIINWDSMLALAK
jgi:hypothetical protein